RRHQGLVVASRITGGSEEYTRVRAFGNIVLTWFFGFVHGRYLSDALNGFKIFHRDIVQRFPYTSDHFEIEIELLVNALRLGRPITEIPSRERSRLAGRLKSSVVKHGLLFMSRIVYEKFRRV
ncbi:MAG: glycosyl transferase, partial [Candidatus Omnitrophica bacterium]|nr:glycosyl transferase [Candidatus Omnitrophota bacterium]